MFEMTLCHKRLIDISVVIRVGCDSDSSIQLLSVLHTAVSPIEGKWDDDNNDNGTIGSKFLSKSHLVLIQYGCELA